MQRDHRVETGVIARARDRPGHRLVHKDAADGAARGDETKCRPEDRLRHQIHHVGADAGEPRGMREHRHHRQGKHAGRNMAGADEPFTYMPFFFSDLFELGYEAVGDVDSRLETFADWQEENKTGVIYYLKDDRVRGAMMCNVWNQVDAARALIRKNEPVNPESLRGTIR